MAAKVKKDEVVEYDWDQFSGETGLENLTSQDLGIPILSIIQKGSPEFDEDHEDHETKKIEGCKVGDIFNSVTRELVAKDGHPVKVVPYYYPGVVYLEWRPKSAGGGIVRTHTDPQILAQTTRDKDTSKDVLPNGNTISTTAYFFVRILHEDREPEDALITLSSTQLKKSRLWLNMMKNFRSANGNTLPMFHRAYYLSSVGESNTKGSWKGWKIEPAAAPLADKTLIDSLVESVKSAHGDAQALIGSSTTESDRDII